MSEAANALITDDEEKNLIYKAPPGLTPRKAIRMECRWCSAVTPEKCLTRVCNLSLNVFKCRSSVRRIRAHCLDCASLDLGETPAHAVLTCNGRLMRKNGNRMEGTWSICWLHPYRLGKNPDRPKRRTPSGLGARGAEVLKSYRRRQRPDAFLASQNRRSPPGEYQSTGGIFQVGNMPIFEGGQGVNIYG